MFVLGSGEIDGIGDSTGNGSWTSVLQNLVLMAGATAATAITGKSKSISSTKSGTSVSSSSIGSIVLIGAVVLGAVLLLRKG